LRLWTQPAGIRSGLHMARWVEGVGVLSQYSWHFLGWGLLFSCILHICVWISEVVFICCLGSRQHCCSFFTLTAPGLALSPCFQRNVPQIPFLVIRYYFHSGGYFVFIYGGLLSGYGGRKAGYHWVVFAIGTYFHGCIPVRFSPGYIHGWASIRVLLWAPYSGRYRLDI
jgi:hypothetical protein